jgi:type II secretory pathway component PulC
LAIALAAALLWMTFHERGDRPAAATAAPAAPVWREPPVTVKPDFSVLRGPAEAGASTNAAAFLTAFRFAGSFFFDGGGDAASLRRGVLSYLPGNRQDIVSEGDVVAGVLVKRISEDRIVLEMEGVEGTLTLGGGEGAILRSYLDPAALREPDGQQPQNRFGEQTGDGVWTLRKEALQAYYDELLEDPERLLQVFDSMAPLYAEDGTSIEGYQLRAVGEQSFFEAVGVREGDVVRKVNALPMTNRRRAEFFIRQVVQDRVSAIVIDIEREGKPKRLVYQLR